MPRQRGQVYALQIWGIEYMLPCTDVVRVIAVQFEYIRLTLVDNHTGIPHVGVIGVAEHLPVGSRLYPYFVALHGILAAVAVEEEVHRTLLVLSSHVQGIPQGKTAGHPPLPVCAARSLQLARVVLTFV